MPRKFVWFLGITLVVGLVGAVTAVSRHFLSRPPAAAVPAVSVTPLAERETWSVCRILGERAGYGRVIIRNKVEDGQPVVKVQGLFRLNVPRFGQVAQVEMGFTDTETPAGVLLDSEYEMREGPQVLRSTSRVRDGHLEVEVTTRGERHTDSLPWSADNGGMWAVEGSLLRQPMHPGEHRVINHLSVQNLLVKTDMTARQKEEDVDLLAGTFRLLRIDAVDQFPGGHSAKGAYWIDSSGEIFKWWTEPMNMESFRVPMEVALATTLGKFDLGLDTLVKLDRPLPHGDDAEQARYLVQIKGGSPLTLFVSSASQRVRWTRLGADMAEITVYAIRPGRPGGNPEAQPDPPTDADRQPNNFIQSDDAQIVADAQEAAPDESDPWRVAVALERYVHDKLGHKDLAQAFVTAADVARSRQGDCKAHALYLAALARTRGIPARVAVGLVYMPEKQAFAYHMWTQVYVSDRWIPIDGTLAKGGIGAGHLELAHSNMAGVAAYESFLPVIEVIGRLQVHLLPAQ
jgi:hypothetical protein